MQLDARPISAPRTPILALLLGCALAAGLLPRCSSDPPEPLLLELFPGETGYLSLEVNACSTDDELLSCYAEIYDTQTAGLDLDLLSAGPRSDTDCGVQLKVTVDPDAPRGHHSVSVLLGYTYYDAFFEDERSGDEVVRVQVRVLAD